MTSTTATVESLAEEAASYFEGATRGEGDEAQSFRRLKSDRPEWVYDLVHEAHGDFFPDDWRYNCIENALEAIAQGIEPGEFADGEVDSYNASRVQWLESSIYRGAYCDDAIEEFGPTDQGIYGIIGMGQYMEASEIYGLVMQQLESELEDRDA